MGEPESRDVGGAEKLTCPRKRTNCHPLDLIASGDAFTCCGAPEAFLPYRVCMGTAKTERSMLWNYNETQLLNMVSVVARSLASVKE